MQMRFWTIFPINVQGSFNDGGDVFAPLWRWRGFALPSFTVAKDAVASERINRNKYIVYGLQ